MRGETGKMKKILALMPALTVCCLMASSASAFTPPANHEKLTADGDYKREKK
jgi:hypothetical protein